VAAGDKGQGGKGYRNGVLMQIVYIGLLACGAVEGGVLLLSEVILAGAPPHLTMWKGTMGGK
jgi:hypothetical protein